MLRAADRLVQLLAQAGVERVFCVPGESYLTVLDALHDAAGIAVVACRHEGGAAHMAEAHAKLTGGVGVCFVTRGPGATHASIGVHTAFQDSTPMLLFVGQVARTDKDRDAFQELDYGRVFGGLAKWAAEIPSAARLEEYVARALLIARSGRPGPVVLALPEDILDEPAGPATPGLRLDPPAAPPPGAAALANLGERLARAERPLLLLGGSDWTAPAAAALQGWAERHGAPVALAFRRKHLIDNESPAYVGDFGFGLAPHLARAAREADLIVAVGTRLGEVVTQGYSLFTREETAAKLVHVHPEPTEIGRVWPVALGIAASSAATGEAIAGLALQRNWRAWAAPLRAAFEAFSTPGLAAGPVDAGQVFAQLGAALPPDAIVCNGAGNYAAFLHRYFRHRRFGTQAAPTSGAMGYGVPAAVAAKLAFPGREVFAIAGDGCFLMSANELATAQQYGAAIRVLVFDNGGYGTIRMHQAKRFPGRVSGTRLQNPDFAALARSFGAAAWRVERTQDFLPALEAALREPRPALLHLCVSMEDIAPGQRLSGLEAVANS